MAASRLHPTIPRFALIVGGMKCGTTSLFRYLAQHPEVCGSRPKEPHFFNDDKNWAKGLAWYEARWKWDPARHAVALEGSTGYSKAEFYPEAAGRIARLDADVRLIYMVRDPLARIESHYRHAFSQPWGGRVDLDPSSVPDHQIAVSDYAGQLDALRAAMPAHPLLVLRMEDLMQDPHAVLAEVCTFLELSRHRFSGVQETHNPSDEKRVMRPMWQRMYRERDRAWIVRASKIADRVGAGALFWTTKVPQFRLNDTQRAYTRERLAPGMKRLHQAYGVDVSAWGF